MKEEFTNFSIRDKDFSVCLVKRLRCFLIIFSFVVVSAKIFAEETKTSNSENHFKASVVQAQSKKVTGKVLDDFGLPIPGVTVRVKDSSVGTITDINGNFELAVPASGKVIVFSAIGMKTIEANIDKTAYNIVMEEDAISIDEVVVVGYGQQTKVSVTGAIATVDTKEMIKSPSTSVQNALAGRSPGLTIVQKGGAPGQDFADIFIRGRATYGNSSPLILVDGIERDITTIDPNEIESINVLKDASATAVYGVRGANGVIVVTTKVGNTSTKPTITFTANYGVSNPTRIPRYLNSAEYARMTNLASLNDVRTAEFPNGPASFTFPFSDQDIALYENGADPIFHPNTDWMATIIKRNAPQQNYNVNISGGTTKMKYFASLGYFNQVGNFGGLQVFKNVPVNGNLNRYNIRLNTDFEWTKKFSTSFKFATQITEGYNTNIVIGSANMLHHIFSLNPLVSVPYIDGKIINNAPELAGYEISANPLKQYNGSYSLQYQARTTIDFSTEYKLDDITKGLSVKGKFAYDNLYSLRSNRSRTTPGYDLIRTAPGYTGDYYTFVQTSFEGPFSSNENYSSNYRLYSEASLNYNRNFYRSHKVGALLLGTMERWYRGGNPALPFNYMGIVGRATYNFRDKYLAEFNMGYNGSENFAKGKQFGFFPAYSLGYVISEEEFFPQDFFISFLKIRGSQGKVGNDKVSNTRFLYTPSSYELVNAGSGTIRFGESNTTPDGMYREAKIGNPDVTWEVATKSNIGFEMKLFNDRFSFATDLFSENREGILGNYNNVPMTFGNLSLLPSYNLGVVKNAGYEFEVGYRSSKRRKLQFWVNANYSFARNEIVYNDEIPPEYPNLIRTGKPIGQPFMYTTNGYYNSWEEVNDPNRTRTKWDQNVQPGDLKFVDLTGDNFVDENDLSAIGYGQVPEITYGLNFGVRYSGFDLSALIQGVDNVSNYYSTPIIMRIKWSARTEADFFAWTEERYKNGQEIRYPRVGNGGASANNMENSYQNLDASYVRLKNLEFGYAINKSTVKKLGLDGLRFYISGQNLLLFSKMEYWDPESARGTDRQYPVTRVVNFGAKANF